jgi:hypothetical protein
MTYATMFHKRMDLQAIREIVGVLRQLAFPQAGEQCQVPAMISLKATASRGVLWLSSQLVGFETEERNRPLRGLPEKLLKTKELKNQRERETGVLGGRC